MDIGNEICLLRRGEVMKYRVVWEMSLSEIKGENPRWELDEMSFNLLIWDKDEIVGLDCY